MFVKICGITRHEDAEHAIQAGACAVGFNFWPGSPRCITPSAARAIATGPQTVRVGVFVNAAPETIAATVEEAGLDVIQLHGDESPDSLPLAPRVWKAFRVNGNWKPDELDKFQVEAFLLDGPMPGSDDAFDWTVARALRHRNILAGGLGPDNVARAIREVRPWGVDACSRLESAPGIKDPIKMRQFIQAALSESFP